jgi:hypothetical protein
VDDDEPFVVPLESATDWMPSFYWRGPAEEGEGKTEAFGSAAAGYPNPVRSVKLGLQTDEASEETYGERPSEIARLIVQEATTRALQYLKRQGLVPPETEYLEVASNVGCSAAWDLPTRSLMRDVALEARLKVSMLNVIEEPVSASLAVMLTGAFSGGRLLLVDLGGGTLDTCVLSGEAGSNKFRIFASRGRSDLGGDRYTDLIFEQLLVEIAAASGVAKADLQLPERERSRLWQAAERAKIDLSTRDAVRVATGLADGDTTTITRVWFERAAAQLVLKTMAAVNDAYRMARLVLDRGQTPGDQAGTPYLSFDPVIKISNLRLEIDGVEHLDHVVLVGGASQMPMIRREFQRIFNARLEDPSMYGLEPVSAVVSGLAQHEALESLDFGYPNWAVVAEVRGGVSTDQVTMYSPFAPIFKEKMSQSEVTYSAEVGVAAGSEICRLRFHRVAPGEGKAWPDCRLPHGTTRLRLDLSLLGDLKLHAIAGNKSISLYPDKTDTPWKQTGATHPDYLPRQVAAVPTLCSHGAKPGTCVYYVCRNHQSGGMDFLSK